MKHQLELEFNSQLEFKMTFDMKRGLRFPFSITSPSSLGPFSNSGLQGPPFQLLSITYDLLKQS